MSTSSAVGVEAAAASTIAPPELQAASSDKGVALANSRLRDAVDDHRHGRTPSKDVIDRRHSDLARVEVEHHLGAEEVRRVVESVGGQITTPLGDTVVEALVPIDRLEQLEASDGIDTLRTPTIASAIDATTSVVGTQGVEATTKTNAAAWHAAGYTGAGVKIGIIDLFSGTKWASTAAAGELPQLPADKFCRDYGASCDIWTTSPNDHGEGVAEIITDQAPGAQLYIATVTTAADLQLAVDWLVSKGVRIVSRSLTSEYDGAGNGTGEIAGVIANAVSRGITWFNAAGNGAKAHWRGSWTDANNNGWLDFAPGVERMSFDCDFVNGLRWSDWGANRTDYNVYVYASGSAATASAWSENQQLAGADPIELLNASLYSPNSGLGCGNHPTVYLSVALSALGSGTAGDVLEFMTNGASVQFPTAAYSAAGPAADTDNPGAMAIGAVDPALGTTIAPYSAQGPTNDLRMKPDLSAASCISSVSAAPRCFNGTSAATPVTAGAIALVLEAYPGSTPADFKTWIMQSAVVDRGVAGWDNIYGAGEFRLPAPPTGNEVVAPSEYKVIAPGRLMDSRPNAATIDGISSGIGLRPAGSVTQFQVAGRNGIPADAQAVVLNLTVTQPQGDGYITVFPCGSAQPNASNENYAPGQTVANTVIAQVGGGGTVCVYTSAGAHLIADANGFYPAGSMYTVIPPGRLMDTRPGAATIDGISSGIGLRPAGSVTQFQVTGRNGIPANAQAVALNLTVTQPQGDGYITVFPCGSAQPNASNENYARGQTVANTVIAQVGGGGNVCVYTSAGAHLIADANGFYPAGSAYTVVPPGRLMDTRPGAATIDGVGAGIGLRPAGSVTQFQVTGRNGIPADAQAVVLNFTVTQPQGDGYITVFPCGGAQPNASNENYAPGQTVANSVIAQVGVGGNVCVYTSAAAHIIADVNGYEPA